MAAITETIEQATTAAWASATTVPLVLENIGNVTRYEVIHEAVPNATFVAANQPDGLYRPYQNIQVQSGARIFFALPSDGGGHGGTILHLLNEMDGLGVGHTNGGITAPDRTFVPIKLAFHAGVYPKRGYGRLDNKYDLSAFIPARALGGMQLTWTTNTNDVMDDTVTLSSGTLRVTSCRVLGSEGEIQALMMEQGLGPLLAAVGSRALTPAWQTDVQIMSATAAQFGLRLNAKTGGFLKRATFLAQDAVATRPGKAQDELTDLRLLVPGRQKTYFQHSVNNFTGRLPLMTQLSADDVSTYGGSASKGFYPVDLREEGENELERALGLDLRNVSPDQAVWGQTILTYTSGDDVLVLSEVLVPYNGTFNT